MGRQISSVAGRRHVRWLLAEVIITPGHDQKLTISLICATVLSKRSKKLLCNLLQLLYFCPTFDCFVFNTPLWIDNVILLFTSASYSTGVCVFVNFANRRHVTAVVRPAISWWEQMSGIPAWKSSRTWKMKPLYRVHTIDVINVFLRFFLFRSRFLRFLTFFFIFPRFLFLKNVVECKVWICKNPTKNILRRWLCNDFYWFWFVT